MSKQNDLSRSAVALEQDITLIVVIEMSQSSWLLAAMVPGLDREPLKKLPPDPAVLLAQLQRWRDEAAAAGHAIARIAVTYEAGRDGFWLARWLRARGIEAHVMHASSIPVARTHRRAKTDRLDTKLLKRSFLGWLRGEPEHCSMAALPTLAEEDAKRPSRERQALVKEKTRIINRMKATLARLGIRDFKPGLRKAAERLDSLRTPEDELLPPNTKAELRHDMERLRLLTDQIKQIETAQLERLEQAPDDDPQAMVRTLNRVHGLGLGTSDLLAHEAFVRSFTGQRAVARYGGLTGAPDESGQCRREKGLARAGNARVRCAMIQFAWRFLRFQKHSDLAKWYRQRTEAVQGDRRAVRKTMIVALARKLLIALWRLVTTGEVPQGLIMRPAV